MLCSRSADLSTLALSDGMQIQRICVGNAQEGNSGGDLKMILTFQPLFFV